MQYSNCALTSDLYNLSTVGLSLTLVTIVLHIIPKVELIVFEASANCLAVLHSYVHNYPPPLKKSLSS